MPRGLYLHFPFCRHLCPYCDYFRLTHDAVSIERYFDALRIETELVAESCRDRNTTIDTIYIGGGTPSLIAPAHLGTWLDQVRRLFEVDPTAEFSLEINPESCSLRLLEALSALGVNRPVLGIQTFDRRMLKKLGRRHNLAVVHEAIYYINTLDFASYGVDLLYGLPGQTAKMLSTDLDQIVDLEPPHVSFYQLTLEPGIELYRQWEAGKIKMPSTDFARALYQAGYEHLTESGLERYEVCSFAREGHACRHNLNYWTGGDYFGLGPSAHSFVDGQRFANVANLPDYLAALGRGERPLVEDDSGRDERIVETVMLGLRTSQGINLDYFRQRFGTSLVESLKPEQYRLLTDSGHLVEVDGFIRLTNDSLLLADEISLRLMR